MRGTLEIGFTYFLMWELEPLPSVWQAYHVNVAVLWLTNVRACVETHCAAAEWDMEPEWYCPRTTDKLGLLM